MNREEREDTKQYYGCVHCRGYHYEGQQEFQEHYWWQTADGVRRISRTEWSAKVAGSIVEVSQVELTIEREQTKNDVKHYYGCVQCEQYHYEGEQAYQEHFWWQTVEGVRELSERQWAVATLRKLA